MVWCCKFIFQTSFVKQLELGSLWNMKAYLVSWLEMHFCKKNKHESVGTIPHNIPLNLLRHIIGLYM